MLITDSKFYEELDRLLVEDDKAKAETIARRKRMITLARYILEETGETFFGYIDEHNEEFYFGPDVDNKRLIYVTGRNARLPYLQMKEDGKRSSLRKARTPRQYKPKIKA